MPFPNFDPVLVHIGPFAIRWYALAYIAGIMLGWRYGVSLSRNARLWRGSRPTADAVEIDDLVLWITLGILIGGRLGSILFYSPQVIWTDPLQIVRVWDGGMSFHGGLIGVVCALLYFSSRKGIDLVRLGDLTAPCVPFGLFFGRIANFVNGELWGRPTTLPWGIIFPRAGPLPRHPSELYEASLEGLALFVILRIATHQAKLLPRRGALSGLFLIFYALFRISLENVREPDRDMPQFPFGLTMGIMLSIPMLIAGLYLLSLSRRPDALAPPAPPPGEEEADAVDAPLKDVPEISSDLMTPATESPAAARSSHGA